MQRTIMTLALAATASLMPALALADRNDDPQGAGKSAGAQLGPRPFFLVNDMTDSPLKQRLLACTEGDKYKRTQFSIGHRGAALQFPEHTKESYEAAARMGAGIVECDVTFTKDKELVCRHAQNDLHTTTNILATPLAAKCIKPFTPATFDAQGKRLTAGQRRVPHERHHAGRVQDAARQDGRLQPERAHAWPSTSAARPTSAPTCTRAPPAAPC